MHFLPMILSLLTKDGMLVTDNVLQDGDIIQSRYAITKRDAQYMEECVNICIH